MSPLRRSIRKSYREYERPVGPAKLYLDDLDDILRELEKVSRSRQAQATNKKDSASSAANKAPEIEEQAGREENIDQVDDDNKGWASLGIQIRAGEAVADTVDDLRDATRDDLRTVSIWSRNPDLRVWFSRYSSSISTGEQDPDVRSLVEDLADFISIRRMRWRISATSILTAVAAVIIGGAGAILRTEEFLGFFIGGCLGFAFWAITSILSDLRPSNRRVIVIAERRSEARGISRQTLRDLSIALVGTAVGAILAVIGAIIVDRMSK